MAEQRTTRLKQLYRDPKKIVTTGHRGFSGRYPENTLIAFRKALRVPVDIIEFDVRSSRDDVPVILHDETIDRTSNGTGLPRDHTLEELRQLNFSHWHAAQRDGHRLERPAYPDVTIPTLEEALDCLKGKAGLNIQVCDTTAPVLSEICRLYHSYDLYDEGYLSMSTFGGAELVRALNPRIELCILERQNAMDATLLKEMKDYGCTFVQPGRKAVTPEFCSIVKDLGLCANMFWSNTDEDNRKYIGYGLQGILTDYPDVLRRTIRDMGRQ
jgi:glycerophosphoryl diester phosphodiesterase